MRPEGQELPRQHACLWPRLPPSQLMRQPSRASNLQLSNATRRLKRGKVRKESGQVHPRPSKLRRTSQRDLRDHQEENTRQRRSKDARRCPYPIQQWSLQTRRRPRVLNARREQADDSASQRRHYRGQREDHSPFKCSSSKNVK